MVLKSAMPPNAALSPPQRPYILRSAPRAGRREPAIFDELYIRRLVDGDPATEQHFVAYFGDLLWAMLRWRVRSPQLLEDVRQETFLRVLRNLRANGMDHPERLGAYVVSVCRNTLFESFRAESRFCEMGDEGPALIDPKSGADQVYITGERKQQVDTVMKGLPGKDRDLLQALFLDELDKDEICRRFNVDRDYLRVLLHRARLKFRAVYAQSYAAHP